MFTFQMRRQIAAELQQQHQHQQQQQQLLQQQQLQQQQLQQQQFQQYQLKLQQPRDNPLQAAFGFQLPPQSHTFSPPGSSSAAPPVAASAATSASLASAAAAASAAASRQTGPSKISLEDIVSKVQRKIPSMTKEAIIFKIDIVRKNNNGSIRNLTLSTLIDQIKSLNTQGSNPV